MLVNFYRMNSDPREVGKPLMQLNQVQCLLKEDCTVLHPVILLNKENFHPESANYMYLDTFRRYYFIGNFKMVTGGMVEVPGEVDVLQTYAGAIRNIKTTIVRQEYNFNQYFADEMLPVRATRDIQYKRIGQFNSAFGIYLTVDGGEE